VTQEKGTSRNTPLAGHARQPAQCPCLFRGERSASGRLRTGWIHARLSGQPTHPFYTWLQTPVSFLHKSSIKTYVFPGKGRGFQEHITQSNNRRVPPKPWQGEPSVPSPCCDDVVARYPRHAQSQLPAPTALPTTLGTDSLQSLDHPEPTRRTEGRQGLPPQGSATNQTIFTLE